MKSALPDKGMADTLKHLIARLGNVGKLNNERK
jgi:hypothetical protein